MPRLYQNVGYEKYFQNEEDSKKFLNFLVNTSEEVIKGYKNIYLQHSNGNVETDVCIYPINKNLELKSVNVHCSNMNSWKLKVNTILNLDYEDYTAVSCSSIDDHGMMVGTIILPDVLPRIGIGTEFEAQVAVFPLCINFFKTSEEAVDFFGGKTCIANGTIFPVEYLCYLFKKEKSEEETKKIESDDIKHKINLIRGTIKEIDYVWVDKIYRIVIDTNFGETPLYFSKEMTKGHEPLVGEEIVTSAIISLDVGILDRAKARYDEDSLYELFLDAIEKSGGSRLINALADDCIYYSEWVSSDLSSFNNKEDIIKRMNDVIKARKNYDEMKVYGKITKISGYEDEQQEHKFNIGDKCILFSNHVDKGWDCAFFLKIENEKIKEIYITTDSNYIFNNYNEEKNTEKEEN